MLHSIPTLQRRTRDNLILLVPAQTLLRVRASRVQCAVAHNSCEELSLLGISRLGSLGLSPLLVYSCLSTNIFLLDRLNLEVFDRLNGNLVVSGGVKHGLKPPRTSF